jgi:hypothetical protein
VRVRADRDDGRCDVAAPDGDMSSPLATADLRVDELEDFELAFARLAWVRTARCQQLASQRAALDWHVVSCEAALSVIEGRAGG